MHHSLASVFVFMSLTLCYCDTHSLDVDWFNQIHVVVFTDADNFEPKEPIKKATTMDKWEGEDEDENVKVNYMGLLRFFLFFFSRAVGCWSLSVGEALSCRLVKPSPSGFERCRPGCGAMLQRASRLLSAAS